MSAATDLYYELVIDTLGRPLLANATHKLHHHQVTRLRGEWRDAATVLARQAKIPRLSAISLVVQPRYRNRVGCDVDAPAPAVKGVLDGLVLAGVILDDAPPFVQSVTYLAAEIGTGLPDALRVEIHPEQAA